MGYNTIQNADDLNDLRIALRVEKINLLAISYGTHLALAAARKYPGLINDMILIGTSGPGHMHHLPFTYDKQLKAISELAAQDITVNRQVPDMLKLLKSVLAKLEREPIQLQVKDNKKKQLVYITAGKFGLQMLLRLDAGDSNDFIYFPALLYGIEQGDFTLFQKFLQKRFNQFNGDYGSAISVMRTASGASRKRYRKIATQGKTALLGNAMNTPDIYARNHWGDTDLGPDFRKLFQSKIRTLFISGTMDSNTPPSNASEVRKGFQNSAHLLVQYAGHEDMLPHAEVRKAIIKFYEGKDLDPQVISLERPRFIAVSTR
jgi:pimeloyl-ACP methyl ester carboxylesterase